MAVRVTDGDLVLTFDSPKEAAEYRALIAQRKPEAQTAIPKTRVAEVRRAKGVGRENGSGGGWKAFASALDARKDERAGRMKRLLALVKGRGTAGVSWKEVTRDLNFPADSTAYGTLSGLGKSLRSAGLNPKDVILAGPDKKLRPGRVLVENDTPTP